MDNHHCGNITKWEKQVVEKEKGKKILFMCSNVNIYNHCCQHITQKYLE